MISALQRRSYKEILIILNELEIIEKIPQKLLEKMENEQDNNWNFIYDKNLPLESQNILKNTAELLSIIYLMFICEDEKEKQTLYEIYTQNEEIYNKNMKEQYNSNNMLKKEFIENEAEKDTNKQITKYKKTVFNNVINKILKIFHIK